MFTSQSECSKRLFLNRKTMQNNICFFRCLDVAFYYKYRYSFSFGVCFQPMVFVFLFRFRFIQFVFYHQCKFLISDSFSICRCLSSTSTYFWSFFFLLSVFVYRFSTVGVQYAQYSI